MTKQEWATTYAYELFNVAEHCHRLAEDVQLAIKNGRPDRAKEALESMRRSAEMVDYRFRDAVSAVGAYADDEAAK